MKIIVFIVNIYLVVSVKSYVLNYDTEDHIFDMLLNDNYISYESNQSEEALEDQKPILVNGVWQCGNCSDITEINLMYNESYDVETKYDDDAELQIGFSLDNMRCIKISADEDAEVESISGACASDAVTLRVLNTNHCDISIYG